MRKIRKKVFLKSLVLFFFFIKNGYVFSQISEQHSESVSKVDNKAVKQEKSENSTDDKVIYLDDLKKGNKNKSPNIVTFAEKKELHRTRSDRVDPSQVEEERLALGARSFKYSLSVLLTEFGNDMGQLAKISNKIIISSYSHSRNLKDEFQSYVLKEITREAMNYASKLSIIKCIECLTVQYVINDEEWAIRKGFIKKENLDKILKEYGTQAYMEINLFYAGADLVLQVEVINQGTHETIFSKKYETRVFRIREEGLILGLSALVSFFASKEMKPLFGGRIYLGHRLPSVGEVGFFVRGLYSEEISNKKPIISPGIFVDIDINDLFKSYWSLGTIYLINDFGISFFDGAQLYYGSGVKFNMASLFHFYSRFAINIKSNAVPEGENSRLVEGEKIPFSLLFGFGFDFG